MKTNFNEMDDLKDNLFDYFDDLFRPLHTEPKKKSFLCGGIIYDNRPDEDDEDSEYDDYDTAMEEKRDAQKDDN
ncbi:MAG: hypothetical protein WC139_13240 [Candidatus Kapaibacterium sp.]